jgi:dGTPase
MTSNLAAVGSFREHQELLERSSLFPFATLSENSRGRMRHEELDPVRTAFQRDRDRILHSKAFRRLKHKTQVFIDPEEDHYRTRLTHTLEVSQIARTLARALRLNEDLTEAISLAHDLGHTPFGHGGEEALDEALRAYVAGASFRHYEQSLRIVDVLEKNGAGLNLTYEVRDGILGHSKGSKDLQVIDPNHMPESLEGMCVRVADRIAYLNHDIDDSVRAQVLNVDELPQDALDILGRTHGIRIATMVMNVLQTSFGKPEVGMSGDVLQATNALKDYMYEHVYTIETRGNMELTKAQFMLKELFNLYMTKPDLIPARELVPIEDEKLSERDRLAYQVTDFIAGMTDRYATMKFKYHFFPVAWSN